jgi:hypothetical protein
VLDWGLWRVSVVGSFCAGGGFCGVLWRGVARGGATACRGVTQAVGAFGNLAHSGGRGGELQRVSGFVLRRRNDGVVWRGLARRWWWKIWDRGGRCSPPARALSHGRLSVRARGRCWRPWERAIAVCAHGASISWAVVRGCDEVSRGIAVFGREMSFFRERRGLRAARRGCAPRCARDEVGTGVRGESEGCPGETQGGH